LVPAFALLTLKSMPRHDFVRAATWLLMIHQPHVASGRFAEWSGVKKRDTGGIVRRFAGAWE
jgi:hypothetical protein